MCPAGLYQRGTFCYRKVICQGSRSAVYRRRIPVMASCPPKLPDLVTSNRSAPSRRSVQTTTPLDASKDGTMVQEPSDWTTAASVSPPITKSPQSYRSMAWHARTPRCMATVSTVNPARSFLQISASSNAYATTAQPECCNVSHRPS